MSKKIKFIEETHQYLTDEDRELISVSKFTDKFKEPVNWKAIADNIAKNKTKNGEKTTGDEILKKWENKRVKSSQIGTLYHEIREKELIEGAAPTFYGKQCKTKQCEFENGFKYSIPINQLEFDTVYAELMIYDFEYMICGQSDKVIVTGNKINIWDYKTDEDISMVGYMDRSGNKKKLLPPLSHLDDCDYNNYSIKMSLYMYLLWRANRGRFRPGELIIEHVHLRRDRENDNIPILIDGKPVVTKIENIVLPYRKREIIAMLETLK